MSDDRFHKAARDGYLDLLREGTKHDLNKKDEDGMTPTLWAAFHGNLEALRLICGRGGDPDRFSLIGNTALHCSAHNGHLNCVSFLLNFGVNIWALDNEFHTAMDLAAMQEHMEIVRYLDECVAKESMLNKKTVAKLKEKSILDAQKRVKIYEKLQKQANHRAEIEHQQQEEWQAQQTSGVKADRSTLSKINQFRRRISHTGTVTSNTSTTSSQGLYSNYVGTGARKAQGPAARKAYERVNGTTNGGFNFGPAGKQSVRSLQEVAGGNVIMGRAISEPEIYQATDSGYGGDYHNAPQRQSIFERPGFGNVAFRRGSMADAFCSLPGEGADDDGDGAPDSTTVGTENSIGSAGSLAQRTRIHGDPALPWSDDVLIEEDEYDPNCPLEAFLAAHGLQECILPLSRERIDLDALMLVSDSDLKEIGLQLGPRKKLMDAIVRRRMTMDDPGPMEDTTL
ncbi:PREDICTED: Usher syndrome type-1G protein homolog [Priapulus caudatus]|uniref:Usher syndrome type-1G protein homolog n=1 Tax=Priapulus caudatus TaxID=37621 RepID=A0ABM1EY26_PRICU|nr:PREDICTED: Usher syndrome type-1G protein homolog [Priapulus caudatus]